MRRLAVRPLATTLVATLTTGTALVAGQLAATQPALAQPSDPWEACRLPTPAGLLAGNEGWDTHERYLDPTEPGNGTLRGIVLFADFDGAPGTATERDDIEDLVDPELTDWYDAASYGQLTLELDFTNDWERMPTDHDEYMLRRDYMQDAVEAWDMAVDFTPYDLVYVVPPEAADITAAGLITSAGNALVTDEGPKRYGAVLTGWTAFGYQIAAHETGHVFGLPDLYTVGEGDPVERAKHAGGWDTMGRVDGPAPELLAYHKWKVGWLEDDHMVCMDEPGTLDQVLSPLHTVPGGTTDKKAVMIPIDTSRLVVVENRDGGSVLDGTPPECYQEGLLTYVVDSRPRSGGEMIGGELVMPVEVIDANPGPMATCDALAMVRNFEQVREKADATLTNVSDTVATEGVSAQLIGISGADREVRVSWTGAAAPCEVEYVIASTWTGNVQVDLTVANTTSQPLNGWTAEWTFTGDENVYNSWGVAVSQVGAEATATGDDWGAMIPAEDEVTVGFQATVTGTPTVPPSISCSA